MAQSGQNMAANAAGASGGAAWQQNSAPRGRIVFLNALPLNALPRTHLRLDILRVAVNELAQWVQRRVAEGWQVVHYIRHSATVETLRAIGIPLNPQPNSGLYQYQYGDVLIVITLRNPPRGQEQTQVTINDLESWVVTVL
ncbi:MAG: hypothetical protein ACO2PN_08310 [Pyrobaculum sp.]